MLKYVVWLNLVVCACTATGDVLHPEDWRLSQSTGRDTHKFTNDALVLGGDSGEISELILQGKQPMPVTGSIRIDYQWDFLTGHKARFGIGLFKDGILNMNNPSPDLGVFIKGVGYSSEFRHAVDGRFNDRYYINYSVPKQGTFLIERDDSYFAVKHLIVDPYRTRQWQSLFDGVYQFQEPLYPYIFTSNSHSAPAWQVRLSNYSVVPEPPNLKLSLLITATLLLFLLGRRHTKKITL